MAEKRDSKHIDCSFVALKMGSLAIILLNEDLIDLGCTK